METINLSSRVLFAVDNTGIVETKLVLPPALEGFDQDQVNEFRDEFYSRIHRLENGLAESHPMAKIEYILADTPQEAIQMWPEILYNLPKRG